MSRTFPLSAIVVLLVATTTLGTAMAAPGQKATYIEPPAQAVQPMPNFLPKFGFQSYNLRGVGERITFVQQWGLASQLGLEPGDIILRLNGFALNYHGAWNHALQDAVYQGGRVRLAIRDVRTGNVVFRSMHLGGGPGVGPITPKAYGGGEPGPMVMHNQPQPQFTNGNASGPITQKLMKGGSQHLSPAPQPKVKTPRLRHVGQLLKAKQ